MAVFEEPEYICVWQLDTQEMAYFSVGIRCIPPAVIHASLTSHLFIPQDHTVEIWEVSMTSLHMTSPHMIYGKKLLTTSQITSICNGNKILVGSYSGIVSMWNVNLARNQAATMDTQDDVWGIIAVSLFGKMVVTASEKFVELWDTNTWEVIRCMDHEDGMKIAFLPDGNHVAVLLNSLITVWNINNLENRLSFNPWPSERDVTLDYSRSGM